MLDKFLETQFVASSLLKNAIHNNKLSHAYLFDANDFEEANDFILAFVCSIFCENHYTSNSFSKCASCNICNRIKNNNYPELKIIETTSLTIKKEQLLELQSDFSLSSIESKYRVYVIKDCEKMNKQASNCLLKFLEEPTDGIIAILVTNNLGKMLSTIVSRCQIIRLNNCLPDFKGNSFEKFMYLCKIRNLVDIDFEKEKVERIIKKVFDFIDYFEDNGLDVLIFIKSMWYENISSKDEFLIAFLLMIYVYYDALKLKFNYSKIFFIDDMVLLEKISNYNSVDCLLNKVDILIYGYDMLKMNLNLNLLFDDIIIRLANV